MRAFFQAHPPSRRTFCEFGAADGVEFSNTAWLYEEGWSGTYIESAEDRFQLLERNRPDARCIQAMVTRENVNDLVPPALDVLSIDIDGNDYWVWDAYQGDSAVVVIESNTQREGVMPYDPEWTMPKKHSGFGASPDALRELAAEKGYNEVCLTGVNLIFAKQPLEFDWPSDMLVTKYRSA